MGNTVLIGGEGYRWRGRSIRAIRKDNSTCISMPRPDSMIMSPCSVSPSTQYKITVVASKTSGNGQVFINFFGGKNYDGNHIQINIKGTQMKEYVVAVPTPRFPKSVPVYLRVWKVNGSSGNVFINSIFFHPIGQKPDVVKKEEPRLPINPPKIKKKEKKKVETPRSKKRPLPVIVENDEMKFKPYEPKRITPNVEKVLIKTADDVPKVSIITPTRDGINLLKECYEALNKNTSYPNWEWIIGDSESSDGTAECVKGWNDPRTKLVERGTTEGSFSSINNELVGFSDGEYLLFLNDDTRPQPFWLYEMMSKIYNMNNVGVVGARLLYNSNKLQHCGIGMTPQGPANIGKAVIDHFPKDFMEYDRDYQAVTGACLLISKKDFDDIDGFDPVYYFCYEDVDLCFKVKHQLKKRVVYATNAVVYHSESMTQNKHKTAGEKQQNGIAVFKNRWLRKVPRDFIGYQRDGDFGKIECDISFITCVNNASQYRNYVVGSLFKNKTSKNYEIIPIFNFGNIYCAAEALNIGLKKAKGEIVVFCHQDVLFYEGWVDMLFERIDEIEKRTKKWGVLGTAGINKRDDTVGVVHNIKGRLQWQASKRARVFPVQTVDEHCMVIKKSSGLKFDQKTCPGFHFYGVDLCMTAASKGLTNYGILCPLVHDSASGSLVSGRKEFMRDLNAIAKKWRSRFPFIRTPTSIIRRRSVRTFVRFKHR